MPVSDPPLYIDVRGNAGHAHPSPIEPVAGTDNLQRLRDLVDGVTLDITLRGLAAQDNATAPAMHVPRVRRAPFSECSISLLDVISYWKGLSHSQAVELTIWERLFRQCLATQVEERLQDIVVNHLSESQEPINEISLLPRIVECLLEIDRRLIDIDVIRLSRTMIETFYEDHASETASRYFAWSLGSRDLPSFVYNFLRTQDCFLHSPTGPYLWVHFSSHSYTSPVLTVFADLTWLPPDIKLYNVPEKLPPGEEYCIAPQHVDASMEYGSANGYYISDHMHYTISQSALDLTYDPNRGCFRGTVPYLSTRQDESSPVETILSAHIVTPFPDDVRFERTSRYSIKLDMVQPKHPGVTVTSLYHMESPSLPMEGPWVPSYTSTPLSKTRQNGLARETDRVSSHDHLTGSPLGFEDEVDEEIQEAFPAASSTLNQQAQSPTKRKASQHKGPSLENVDHPSPDSLEGRGLKLDIKRRKLVRGEEPSAKMDTIASCGPEHSLDELTINHTNSHSDSAFHDATDSDPVNVITDLTGKAETSRRESFAQHESLETCAAYQHQKPTAAKGKVNANSNVFNWTLADTAPAYSGPPPEDTDSDNSSVPVVFPLTPTDSSHSKQSTELSQEQIQHNYLEFEEQAKRKAAEKAYYATNIPNFDGIVSPTDSVDKDFERVFLEDSEAEDWVSEIDGLSDGVQSVKMDEL